MASNRSPQPLAYQIVEIPLADFLLDVGCLRVCAFSFMPVDTSTEQSFQARPTISVTEGAWNLMAHTLALLWSMFRSRSCSCQNRFVSAVGRGDARLFPAAGYRLCCLRLEPSTVLSQMFRKHRVPIISITLRVFNQEVFAIVFSAGRSSIGLHACRPGFTRAV